MEKLKAAITEQNEYLERLATLRGLDTDKKYLRLKAKCEKLARQAGMSKNQYARLCLQIKMGRS